MKQIVNDFKDELEQNLSSAVNTVKSEPKKFLASAKAAVTGKVSVGNDFGKVLERMATNSKSGTKTDPLLGVKPAPSKKMMGKISDMTAAIAAKRTEELRKRFRQIQNEAINPENQSVATQPGSGPEVKHTTKKLAPIKQMIQNAQTTGESRDGGGQG